VVSGFTQHVNIHTGYNVCNGCLPSMVKLTWKSKQMLISPVVL